MNQVPRSIRAITKGSKTLESALYTLIERKEYTKGEYLFKEGEVCKQVFLIEKGIARIFYYSESGREITSWFFDENTVLTAIDCFYYRQPSKNYCELLEDAVVYCLSHDDLNQLLNTQDGAKVAFYIIYELMKKTTEYVNTLKFLSAEERYKGMMAEYPAIFQRVSLGHIASFLGITQETLSRIRASK